MGETGFATIAAAYATSPTLGPSTTAHTASAGGQRCGETRAEMKLLAFGASPGMAKKPKPAKPLTEGQLFGRLKKRYAAPEYAIFPSVQNSTGYTSRRREADAVAMSLWPSRGLEVLGFEIKSRRNDWMNELRQPKKSEAIQKYCNRWWIVAANKDIVNVDGGELPATWGLMVPRGQHLVTVVEAPPLEAEPLDRGFLAAILRRAQEAAQRPDIEEKVREELRPILKKELEGVQAQELRNLCRRVERAEKKLERYEAASKAAGMSYEDWDIDATAAAVKHVRARGPEGLMKDLLREQSILDGIQVEVRDAIEELIRAKARIK